MNASMNRMVCVLSIALLLVGCGDALVGGRCLPGYIEQPGQGCVRILVAEDAGANDDAAVMVTSDAGPCAADAMCDGVCVDRSTDAQNCGSCGIVCASGICVDGVCRGDRAGHMVLIGHGYERSREDQDRIVGNAVFLASRTPVRVLTYVGAADTSPQGAVDHVDAAITAVGGVRTWVSTPLASPDAIEDQLSVDRFDVVLVYEQTHATDSEIASAAHAMGDTLARFARAGGVVVVLDGARHNSGTYPIATATALLEVNGVRNVDEGIVGLVSPADALATGVRNLYRARTTSVRFDASPAYAVFTSDGPSGPLPVVLHRAVFP